MHSPLPFDAVFTDLDGTLLDEKSEVSDFSLEVMARLADRGVKLVAATGRPVHSVRRLLARARFPMAAITLNGTVVHTDLWADKAHSLHPIEPGVVQRVGAFIHTLPSLQNISFDCVDRWYAREKCDLTGLYEGMYDTPPLPLTFPWSASDGVLSIVLSCEEGRDGLAHELRERFGADVAVTIYRQWPMVEIANVHRNKGQALRELCSLWGMDPARTLAFGDGENDRELMLTSGHAVAMANAQPEILELAHRVAPSHKEEGVAHTLRHIFAL